MSVPISTLPRLCTTRNDIAQGRPCGRGSRDACASPPSTASTACPSGMSASRTARPSSCAARRRPLPRSGRGQLDASPGASSALLMNAGIPDVGADLDLAAALHLAERIARSPVRTRVARRLRFAASTASTACPSGMSASRTARPSSCAARPTSSKIGPGSMRSWSFFSRLIAASHLRLDLNPRHQAAFLSHHASASVISCAVRSGYSSMIPAGE